MTSSAKMGKPMMLETIGMTTDSGATAKDHKSVAFQGSYYMYGPWPTLLHNDILFLQWRTCWIDNSWSLGGSRSRGQR